MWRGRRLKAPPGRSTRPTSDRVREAVFDVLQGLVAPRVGDGTAAGPSAAEPGGAVSGGARPSGRLAGHRVLDVFAGSGALGIEALSRGAQHCTFVERERTAVAALHANLEALGVDAGRRRTGPAAPPALGPPPHGPSGGVAPLPAPPSVPTATIAALDVRRALAADARAGGMYTLVLADPPYARYGELEGDLARLLAPLLAPEAVVVFETRRDQALGLPWRVERVKRYGDTQVVFMVAGAQ
jgi:16S rRNA (guanine966-N2)-methyltransferase